MSLIPGIAASLLDQLGQVAAHQRLAAGQPDLVDAQRRRDPDEPLDLLEGQQLGRGRNSTVSGMQ